MFNFIVKFSSKNKFVLLLLLIIFTAAGFLPKFNNYSKTDIICFIADIHADDIKEKIDHDNPNNFLYPSNYLKNIQKFLQENNECNQIISLGDNLNSDNEVIAKNLKKATDNRNFIWVRGNHDKKEDFLILHPETYFYKDFKNWRIIVLDNSKKNAKNNSEEYDCGKIDKEQMDWFLKSLETESNIIVAMHVPLFNESYPEKIREDYNNFKNILEEKENVRYVFSGHFHTQSVKREIKGIKYFVVPSFSLKGQEGQFVRINLNEQ